MKPAGNMRSRIRTASCLWLGALVFASSTVQAQGFIQAASGKVIAGESQLVTVDGLEVTGRIKSATVINGSLKSFSLVDESGNKTKYLAADVAELRVKVGILMKLDLLSQSAQSIKKLVDADFDEILTRDHVIYERVLLPKKDKYRLLQLLNPGFDGKFKVYPDPRFFAKESAEHSVFGVKVAGGKAKSFLLAKNGQKSVVIKKGSYEKQFEEVFGDCQDILDNFAGKKRKFKHFAEHVFVYDQLCD